MDAYMSVSKCTYLLTHLHVRFKGGVRSCRPRHAKMAVGQLALGRRELASSLLAVASLPSPLTPASPTVGLLPPAVLPPAVTFGVQIYDDATAERLTLQAKRHVARHAHAMHTPCTRGAMRTHELLLRVQALSVGFRSFFTSPEGGNQLGFARAVTPHTARTSHLQAALLLTRSSLASDRSRRAACRGSSCTSRAACSRTCR